MQDDQVPNDKHVKSALLRWVLISCGWIFTLGGVAGIFLPLVPTVPLLLLAAACFARSSERFHTWLMEHNHLGPLVRDYLNGAGIPLRVKRTAIVMIWVSFSISTFLFAQAVWLRVLLIAMAATITVYLLILPTAPKEDNPDQTRQR